MLADRQDVIKGSSEDNLFAVLCTVRLLAGGPLQEFGLAGRSKGSGASTYAYHEQTDIAGRCIPYMHKGRRTLRVAMVGGFRNLERFGSFWRG